MTFPQSITTGISQKSDGSMKINSLTDNQQFSENRKSFFKKSGIDITKTVCAYLTHGTNVALLNEKNEGQIIPDTDGLITNTKGVILTVTLADCIPVFFCDNQKNIIGLAHAGWKGVVHNISKAIVEKMRSEFGTQASDVSVYIGPHIQQCHFEVKEDLASLFDKEFLIKTPEKMTINLLGALKKQLLALGIKSENISSNKECTYCESSKYFSYRRDKPKEVESMVAYISIKKNSKKF